MFYIYLMDKEPTEYTGIESYVRQCIDKGDLKWFPKLQALSVKKGSMDDKSIYDMDKIALQDIRAVKRKLEKLAKKG